MTRNVVVAPGGGGNGIVLLAIVILVLGFVGLAMQSAQRTVTRGIAQGIAGRYGAGPAAAPYVIVT